MTDKDGNEIIDPIREARDRGEDVISQKGKNYFGTPNPNKTSRVKFIYRNEKGRQCCSAMKSHGQEICASTVLYESGRCKYHGGASLTGTAHPNYQSGRYLKNLPQRLRERYEEALEDPDLHSFQEDLALIDARLDDLIKQMAEGGGGEIFTEAMDAYQSFTFANRDGDAQAMRESLRRLETALHKGKGESYLWTEIRHLQEQRRKIVLAEAKRLQLTNQMVTVTKVNIVIAALLDSINRNVEDRDVKNRINQDFLRITNVGRQLKS
jgi:hypothetical protein